MTDSTVTVIGNTTRDPELRFTATGVALAEFGVAVNTRRKVGDRWEDGDPQFYDVVAWRDLAENVAESLTKGTRVIVFGRLDYRQWETQDGDRRSKVQIVADAIGPDLRWTTAQVVRTERHKPAAPAAPAYDPDEDPFRVDAGEWWPTVHGPAWPERILR